jgi:uncharacterized membrane-anchored protein YitT (DUF2179 family)
LTKRIASLYGIGISILQYIFIYLHKTVQVKGLSGMEKNNKLKEALMLNLGVLLLSLGVYFFKIPNGFITGGISGISIIISKLSGNITPSWLIFIINLALLLVGFIVFGKQFGLKTAFCSFEFSIFVVVLEKLFPLNQPLTDQPFLELTFAILLPAVGSAIMFNYSASSGGTDVIAMIFKKYTSMNIGDALLDGFYSCFFSILCVRTENRNVFNIRSDLQSVRHRFCNREFQPVQEFYDNNNRI